MNISALPKPRTREELAQEISSGWVPKWIFFWGHQPSPDGSVTKSCFSQWWDGHRFQVDGVHYRTAEHWMMAEKARLFSDPAILDQILAAANPAVAKKLGRSVAGFDELAWKEARWDIVVRGNVAKFGQNPDLKAFLLGTGERVLVEASPRDRIWGIGLGANHQDAENPSRWRGENLLGFALMETRARLRHSLAPAQ